MRISRSFRLASWFFCGLTVLLSCMVAPQPIQAQQCNSNMICPGDNAVFESGSQYQSHSFIDASQINAGTDICVAINAALQQLASASNSSYYGNQEGVIDARGFSGNSISCSMNPWGANLKTYPYSTILLPAGTIQTQQMWVLEGLTHIT